MIVDFSIKNWMSFKEETKFSFLANKNYMNGRKIPFIGEYDIELLPISALFGGNAAGKTNFVEAFKFAQNMVITGTLTGDRIPVVPFLLDAKSSNQPSDFKFTLLIDKILYEYQFSVNQKKILYESLKSRNPDNCEKLFYSRNLQEINLGNDIKLDSFEIIREITTEGQLFLNNTAHFNLKLLQPVYNWFKRSLRLITPNMVFPQLAQKFDENNFQIDRLNEALDYFDTGISEIENHKLKPEVIDALLQSEDNLRNYRHDGTSNNPELLKRGILLQVGKNEPVSANQLVSKHYIPSGETVEFNLSQESEGTRRLIDLLPSFFDLTINADLSVLIIDEIDRSLHSILTKSLIKSYLETTNENSRIQLLFTTHDQSLLNPKILRRDETWVTERDSEGVTKMYSFGDYKDIPLEKNIFELYESGILRGIPHIPHKIAKLNPLLADNELED